MAHTTSIRWGRAIAGFLLHGALAGVVAAVVYIALTWGQTLPSSYTLAHVLKVIGGAAGGYVVGRSRPAIDRIAARVS
jgi:hypothetical protein